MKFSLLCSFVCFSTLFLGTDLMGTGFTEPAVHQTREDLTQCLFTLNESKAFFAPHQEDVKNNKGDVVDTFGLPGYLRWPSLGGVTEEEEGKRTGKTIGAVMNDIWDLELLELKKSPLYRYTEEMKIIFRGRLIIVFASHGLKGVAAMRFAMEHKVLHPTSKIVVFLPGKRVRISVSDAFSEGFKKELDNSGLTVISTLEDLNKFLEGEIQNPNGYIVEGLFGIGFRADLGFNPEAVPIIKRFLELSKFGWQVISIDVPVLYRVDGSIEITDKDEEKIQSPRVDAKASDFTFNNKKDHEICEPPLIGPDNSAIEHQDYTPFAVIFIGFLKPCYKELHKLPLVNYIYLGGHFLDPLALDKFLGIESIKERDECKGIHKSWFPQYQENKLFHRIKTPTV